MSTRLISRFSQAQMWERPGLREMKAGVRWGYEELCLATSSSRVLPDLVVAGVQRSGTTALCEALYRLPMVERPRRGKGSHYFSYNYSRGWKWFQAQFPTTMWASLVERRTGKPLFCMDACPYYLFHPFAVERMAQALPDVKVLVMLRDPVLRAESHFHHSVAHGNESLGFQEALDAEPERLHGETERMAQDLTYWSHAHEHHSYLAKGMYAAQLKRLFEHYPSDQVMVIQSEDFYGDADRVLGEVTDWLGLPRVGLTESDDRNSHGPRDVDPEIRTRLVEAFRQPNEELFELVGRRYDWIS